ncbi:hypothetical protein L9F63_022429 [Diploptera punctata]|uniref:Uncharacterized protein n=1 Tax=Diploptera punctata TaxID=6984 RepID=A0AAD7ZMG5_DIPPU|nr:hypothetical protein L9F63_022429 [Diploptera punctata]
MSLRFVLIICVHLISALQPSLLDDWLGDAHILNAVHKNSEEKHFRFTRQITRELCCGYEDFNLDKYTNDINTCYKELLSRKVSKGNMTICILECVGKRRGFVNKQGYIKMDKMDEICKDCFQNPEMRDLAENMCHGFDDMNNASKGLNKKFYLTCNSAIYSLLSQLSYNLLMFCPEDMKQRSTSCNEKREEYNQKKKDAKAKH